MCQYGWISKGDWQLVNWSRSQQSILKKPSLSPVIFVEDMHGTHTELLLARTGMSHIPAHVLPPAPSQLPEVMVTGR